MGIRQYKILDNHIIHIFELPHDIDNMIKQLSERGIKIERSVLKKDSLEDYYFSLTGGYRND